MDHLRGEQVNEAQGFLLSKPLDPDTLETQILAVGQLVERRLPACAGMRLIIVFAITVVAVGQDDQAIRYPNLLI